MNTLRRWDELCAAVNDRTTFCMRGVRDPDYPCEGFDPGKPAGDCQSDGHYLCRECSEFDPWRDDHV